MKHTIFVVGIIVAIASSGLIAQNVEVIDIETIRKVVSQPKLSEIASDTWFVKLETNSKCLIGKISSVKLVKDKILIQAGLSRLLLFNADGSFHSQVGRKGNGPGEYTQIFATAVDESSGHIFIVDNGGGRILEFDGTGAFVNSIKNTLSAYEIEVIAGKLYQYTPSCHTYGKDNNHFHLTDNQGSIINSWHPRTVDNKFAYYKEYLQKSRGEILYGEPHWDSVYFFDGNSYQARYLINLGKKALPKEELKKNPDESRSINWRDPYISVSKLIDLENYLFILMTDLKRKMKLIVYNKDTESGRAIDYDKGAHRIGFIDDYSGIPVFCPEYRLADDHVAGVFQARELLYYRDYDMLNLELKSSKRHQELLKIINESESEDNPIIQIVKLK